MRRLGISRLANCLLAAVLVVAALGAGASVRLSPAAHDPMLAAFIAMGGDRADICGGHLPSDTRHCDACRAVGPVVLPLPPRGWLLVRHPLIVRFEAWDEFPPRALPWRTNTNPRAPPVSA